MDTMAMLYNVNVDYYFRVNFYGFIDIIDALGGVTVNSDYAFTTTHGNYTIVQGENYMDGEKALGFVRERYAFASGDRQRGKNQLALIKAVAAKAMSPELLMNYSNILTALEGSFETSIPYDTLSTIVREQLASGGEWNIVSYSVDGTGDSQIPYSMSQYAYVMIPDESTVETAKSLIAQVYNGEIVTAP
jgi:anionic cell wall polymer biosynthesis LytR-Cps2A-Psr (LCP) family protein